MMMMMIWNHPLHLTGYVFCKYCDLNLSHSFLHRSFKNIYMKEMLLTNRWRWWSEQSTWKVCSLCLKIVHSHFSFYSLEQSIVRCCIFVWLACFACFSLLCPCLLNKKYFSGSFAPQRAIIIIMYKKGIRNDRQPINFEMALMATKGKGRLAYFKPWAAFIPKLLQIPRCDQIP